MDWRKYHAIQGLRRHEVRSSRIALVHGAYAPDGDVAEMQHPCCECETFIRHNCHEANEHAVIRWLLRLHFTDDISDELVDLDRAEHGQRVLATGDDDVG